MTRPDRVVPESERIGKQLDYFVSMYKWAAKKDRDEWVKQLTDYVMQEVNNAYYRGIRVGEGFKKTNIAVDKQSFIKLAKEVQHIKEKEGAE